MSEVDIVITYITTNIQDICNYRGNRRGSLRLVDGEWSYHDYGTFKLNSGELYIIAKKLADLNVSEATHE